MQYVELGTTGLQISRIGFGCAAIGGYDYGVVDDGKSALAVRAALQAGINFFDTAAVYGFGHAEELLASALGADRHEAVIATKGGVEWDQSGRTRRTLSPRVIRAGVERSLARLRLDAIPLFQLHWPDPRTPAEAVAECLTRLIEEGKIRFVGVCNFSSTDIHELQKHIPVHSLQAAFSVTEREHESSLRKSRASMGLTSMAYNVLARGFFGGAYRSAADFSGTDTRRVSHLFRGDQLERNLKVLRLLEQTAGHTGLTTSSVAIGWVLDSGVVDCAIVGAKTEAQVVDNVRIMNEAILRQTFDLRID